MSKFLLGKKIERNFENEEYEIKLPFKEITTEKIIEYGNFDSIKKEDKNNNKNFDTPIFGVKNNNINLFCENEAKKKLFNEKDEIKEENLNNSFNLFNEENEKNSLFENNNLFKNENNNSLFNNNLFETSLKNESIFSPLNTKKFNSHFFSIDNNNFFNFNNFNNKSNFLNNKNNEKKEENSDEFFSEENNKKENKPSIIIKKEDENYIKKYSKFIDDIFIFSNENKKFISKGNGILSIEFSKEKSKQKIAILIFRNQTGKILIEGCFNKKFNNFKNYVKNLKNIIEFSIIEINEEKKKNFCLIKIPFSNKEDLNEFHSIFKEIMKFIS